MPITVEYKEAGIYIAHWHNVVAIEEVTSKMDAVRRLADENGDSIYSLIVNLAEVKRIPVDLKRLRGIAHSDPRVLAFIVVEAPAIGRMVGQMLSRITAYNFEFFDRLDDALIRARQLYAARKTEA